MHFSYDPRYNVGYIRFGEKPAKTDTIKISDELVIDITSDGKIYGLELLNANEQLQRDSSDHFSLVNEATGKEFSVPLSMKDAAPVHA